MAQKFLTNFTPPGTSDLYKFRAGALFYGTTSNSTTAMTVSIPGVTEYYTGLTLILKMGAQAASGCTLNVNSLGAKAMKYGADSVGTYFTSGATYLFVYDGTDFKAVHSYNSNTTYSAEKGITLSSGKFGHTNSITAKTTYNQSTASPGYGGTFKITEPKYDAYGHITGVQVATITMPSAYTHPTSSGNKHIPSGGSSGQILRWSADGTAAWGADTNTAHSHSAGVGLTGSGSAGTSGTYTYKVNLVNETASANAASYTAGGTSKFYAVQLDKNNKLGVYVPWTDTHFVTSVNGKTGAVSLTYSDIGAAAASHGTHVSYGTSASAVDTTASAGTATTVSRSDHVHSLSKATVVAALGYTPPTTNTTYGSMSIDEGTTGTATTSRVLTAANLKGIINAHAPTKTGIGASGTWGISISGNAATATNATAASKVNNSLTIKLNGGTTEGTNLFTFNGSAAKSINITPAAIGASASGHTHNYAGSSTPGGSANSAVKLDTATAGDSNTPVYFSGGKPVACTSLDLNTSGNAASASKVNNKLTVGTKNYDGSSPITIVASDLGLSNAMHFRGTVSSKPANTTGYVDGDVILVGNKEYVCSNKAWIELGDESSFSLKGHTHTVTYAKATGTGSATATGTISAPKFTGTAHSHTFTGSSHNHALTPTTATVKQVSSVGTMFAASVSGEVLILTPGSAPTTSNVTVYTGLTIAAATQGGTIANTTAGGTVSAPTFTGTAHSHTVTTTNTTVTSST